MSLLIRFIERIRLALTPEEWAFFTHRYIVARGGDGAQLPQVTGQAMLMHHRVLRKLRATRDAA